MRKQYNAVMQELIIRHREMLETQLALIMIKDKELIKAVVHISNNIIRLCKAQPDAIKAIIAGDSKIEMDLYDSRLYGSLKRIANADSYQRILDVLEETAKNPVQALHVQMCFIYRIFDKLNLSNDDLLLKQYWKEKIHSKNLLGDRARKAVSTTARAFYPVGICRNKFFNAKITEHLTHVPPKEKFRVDEESEFYKTASALNMPTTCGPSGHTVSLVLLAALLGSFNPDQWQNYALITASFLILAGAHSMHECLMVFKTAGVKYDFGNYQSAFFQSHLSPEITEFADAHEHLMKRTVFSFV